jgi:hypothetical protein
MNLEPGDLTVSQITCTLDALAAVRALALKGLSEAEIAERLEWRREDVRRAAEIQGFTVSPLVRRRSLCPQCGHLLQADGSCEICKLRKRLERLLAVNEEEHRREEERLNNQIDAVKQDTHRVRERMGTTPRAGKERAATSGNS